MRTTGIALLAVLTGLVMLGCNNQEGPKTTAVQAEPRSMDQLAPEPQPRPEPRPEPEPAPTAADLYAGDNGGASPADMEPTPAAPRTHIVRKKDTLWSLSKQYLGDPKRWPEIVRANPGLDPKKLPVGKAITIPPK